MHRGRGSGRGGGTGEGKKGRNGRDVIENHGMEAGGKRARGFPHNGNMFRNTLPHNGKRFWGRAASGGSRLGRLRGRSRVRGVPTEETLEEMRKGGYKHLVGAPCGHLKVDRRQAGQRDQAEWKDVQNGIRVKTARAVDDKGKGGRHLRPDAQRRPFAQGNRHARQENPGRHENALRHRPAHRPRPTRPVRAAEARRAAREQGQFMGCLFESLGLGPPGGRAEQPSVAISEAQESRRDKKQRDEVRACHGKGKERRCARNSGGMEGRDANTGVIWKGRRGDRPDKLGLGQPKTMVRFL